MSPFSVCRDSVLGHRDENIKDTFFEEILKHPNPEVWLSQGLEWNICPRNASGREHPLFRFITFQRLSAL